MEQIFVNNFDNFKNVYVLNLIENKCHKKQEIAGKGMIVTKFNSQIY